MPIPAVVAAAAAEFVEFVESAVGAVVQEIGTVVSTYFGGQPATANEPQDRDNCNRWEAHEHLNWHQGPGPEIISVPGHKPHLSMSSQTLGIMPVPHFPMVGPMFADPEAPANPVAIPPYSDASSPPPYGIVPADRSCTDHPLFRPLPRELPSRQTDPALEAPAAPASPDATHPVVPSRNETPNVTRRVVPTRNQPPNATRRVVPTRNQPPNAEATEARLNQSGITISSSRDCRDRFRNGCTSVEGMREATVNGIIAFRNAVGVDLTITGGTEVGHGAGPHSHANGYKVDIRVNEDIDNYITHNFHYIGPRINDGAPVYRDEHGNDFAREGNPPHWDITFLH